MYKPRMWMMQQMQLVDECHTEPQTIGQKTSLKMVLHFVVHGLSRIAELSGYLRVYVVHYPYINLHIERSMVLKLL